MARREHDDPQAQADSLLQKWGSQYDLIARGLFPNTNEGGDDSPPDRVDTTGHSDPTQRSVAKRQHLLLIDGAVRAVEPRRLRQRLYEHYVDPREQKDIALEQQISTSAWRAQRNEARTAFWNIYEDRRKRSANTISRRESERRTQQVEENP